MGGRKTWFRDCLVQFKKEIVLTVSDIGLTNCKKVPNCKIKFQIVKSSKIIMRHNFQLGMDFIEVKATGGMISYALRQAFMPKAS